MVDPGESLSKNGSTADEYTKEAPMTVRLPRRTLLKSIGIGTVSLTAAGPVAADGTTRYIVLAQNRSVRNRIERAGFMIQHTLAEGGVLLVVGASENREKLENINGVQDVARDFRIELNTPEFEESTDESTDEDFFPLQWDKQDLTTDAVIAHDTATGKGTSLAIIDTGVEFTHPDLEANTKVDAGRLFREGAIRSGTGSVEIPKDFGDLTKGTETVTRHVAKDVYGHGTHVAGIAAASNDGTTGVIGTAPDADVVGLRVFWWTEDSDGNAVLFATLGDILTAIDHASAITDADAMNMSLSTSLLPPQVNAGGIRAAWERVTERANQRGTVVAVSAGNEGSNLQQGGVFQLPTAMAGTMAISATGPNDKRVFYSNFGTNKISVGAPGGGYETLEKTLEEDSNEIEWPYPTNLVLNAMDPDTLIGQLLGGVEYAYLAGTSMASPQVTGTVGLIREIAPESTAKQVEKAIEQGAELVSGESDAELGAGRLNAAKALDAPVIR